MKRPWSFGLILSSVLAVCGVGMFVLFQQPELLHAGYTKLTRASVVSVSEIQLQEQDSRQNQTSSNEVKFAELADELNALKLEISNNAKANAQLIANPAAEQDPKLIVALVQEINQLRRDVAELQHERSNTAGDRQNVALEDQEFITPVQQEEELAAQAKDNWRLIESGFSTQEEDTQWATAVSSDIGQAMEQLKSQELASGASISDLDCRSSLCKLEVLHEDATKFEEFEMMLSLGFAEHLPKFTFQKEIDDYGRVQATFYMARTGYDLNGSEQTALGVNPG